jgi:hypothetical protein
MAIWKDVNSPVGTDGSNAPVVFVETLAGPSVAIVGLSGEQGGIRVRVVFNEKLKLLVRDSLEAGVAEVPHDVRDAVSVLDIEEPFCEGDPEIVSESVLVDDPDAEAVNENVDVDDPDAEAVNENVDVDDLEADAVNDHVFVCVGGEGITGNHVLRLGQSVAFSSAVQPPRRTTESFEHSTRTHESARFPHISRPA